MAKDKKRTEQDELGFVFCESEIVSRKQFAQFQFNNGILGIGLSLPKNEELRDKKDNVVGTIQKRKPVVVSRGLFRQPTLKFQNDLKIMFEEIPIIPLRWSLKSIESFKNGESKKVDFKKIFSEIDNQYTGRCFFHNPIWYSIHSLWDIATYFYTFFDAFPIFELRGFKASGKTKTMKISRNITFNATDNIWINPSEATCFRETHAKRPTKYIDEAEKLFQFIKGKLEPDNRVEIINSSFEKGSTVPRQERYGRGWITRYYDTYSPTMVGSINGLHGATEDRAIIHIMTKAPKDDQRQNLDVEDNGKFQEIRDNLYWLMFQEYPNVIKTYNEITNVTELRYNHQKEKSKDKERVIPLSSRDLKIWRPLLTIAYLVDRQIFNDVYDFAVKQTAIKKDDSIIQGSNLDLYLIFIWSKLEKQKNNEEQIKIYINDIRGSILKEEKPHHKSISNQLDKIGFREYREKDRSGSYFNLSKNVFESIISSFSPAFFSSQSSQSSHKDIDIDDNKEIKEEEVCDDSNYDVTNPPKNVTNKRDECDENDECDDYIDMNKDKFEWLEKLESYTPCVVCYDTPTNEYEGKPYCKKHFEKVQNETS